MLYYEVPAELVNMRCRVQTTLDPSLTASETALAAWLQGWQAIETTVKLIPYIGRKDRESSRVWSQANQRLIGETSHCGTINSRTMLQPVKPPCWNVTLGCERK
jgi:hypothetical protein